MRDIYWFQNDLRLQDNPGLLAHANAKSLLCVYCLSDSPPWCQLSGMGPQRQRFFLESLQALRADLRQLGQDLLLVYGDPVNTLRELVSAFGIDRIGTTLTPGFYEGLRFETVVRRLMVEVIGYPGNSLFAPSQIGPLRQLPRQYTPFRQQVEALEIAAPVASPARLPPKPRGISYPPLPAVDTRPHPSFAFRGGAAQGEQRLQQWLFQRQAVLTYKDTRNELAGLDNSSTLSPWLANGGLSARQVAFSLFQFEQQREQNASTRWLFQELLWREFFHWRAYADGYHLFRASGISGVKKLRTFCARDFARWCQGDTNFPLVNALMHQLVESGWMSNRGRQIVASCLINEFNHDWRYGAAFFEKHLIDFDVGSNYGNWQYIAGVGTDPRGGRHFNLQKQAASFDPEGSFTATWLGHQPVQPDHVTDAADWPIMPR
jgi:deoxyribodipyrimidine photo-lyase